MDDDKTRVENALRALFATFDKTANPDMLRGYLWGLRNLSAEQIELAVASAIERRRTFPRPAELLEYAGAVTPERRANLAWLDVLHAVERIGPYRWVRFDDPHVNASIAGMGGWVTFCSLFTDARAEDFTRGKFLKTYAHMAVSVPVDADACGPLQGLATENPPRITRVACKIPRECLKGPEQDLRFTLANQLRVPALEFDRQEQP
jgi:hypothetical protein